MLIILDGPDGSGKTTLAKEICRQTGAFYQHMTYRWPDKMPQYHTAAALHNLKKCLDSNKVAVIDRWWMSEAIYAKVFRTGTKWPHYGRMLDRLLIRYGGLYVICIPSDEQRYAKQFKSLVDSGREMYDNVDKMLEIRRDYYRLAYGSKYRDNYTGYTRLLMKSGMVRTGNCEVYDLHTQGQDVQGVATYIYSRCVTNYISQNYPTWGCATTGDINSHILVVGDKANLKWRDNLPRWPFFENANCSLYLAEVQDKVEFIEGGCYYVNINHENGPYDVAQWLRGNTDPRIIVFGNDAEETFLRHFGGQVKYTPAPHPQAARRFPKYRELFEKRLGDILC